MSPSVSVIIPTHNRAELVRRAIASVLHQTLVPDEVIVIDDGSTDHTPEVLAAYGPPVKVLQQPNSERSAARNHGLSVAQGDLIAFLDSDDFLAPTSIERRVAEFVVQPQIGLVYTDVWIVNRQGDNQAIYSHIYPVPYPSGMVLAELARRCFVVLSSVMVNRAVIAPDDLFFDALAETAEDYDLWLRLAARVPFKYIDTPLAHFCMAEGVDLSVNNWGLPNAPAVTLAQKRQQEIMVQRRVFARPEFDRLTPRQQARIYCSHGMRTMFAGDRPRALGFFWRAICRAPVYPVSYVLFAAGLLGRRFFETIILLRRRVVRELARTP